MIDAEVLEKRFKYSYRYLKFFDLSHDKSWLENFLDIEASDVYGLPEVLVLLHPRWYNELGVNLQINDPRGLKSFSSGPINQECASERYWGYRCPLVKTKIHTDHIFPWSRGGSTHFQNATYLCDEHNLMKFTDIHTMPWEILFRDNNWIRISLTTLMSMARSESKQKLYFPENQLTRH